MKARYLVRCSDHSNVRQFRPFFAPVGSVATLLLVLLGPSTGLGANSYVKRFAKLPRGQKFALMLIDGSPPSHERMLLDRSRGALAARLWFRKRRLTEPLREKIESHVEGGFAFLAQLGIAAKTLERLEHIQRVEPADSFLTDPPGQRVKLSPFRTPEQLQTHMNNFILCFGSSAAEVMTYGMFDPVMRYAQKHPQKAQALRKMVDTLEARGALVPSTRLSALTTENRDLHRSFAQALFEPHRVIFKEMTYDSDLLLAGCGSSPDVSLFGMLPPGTASVLQQHNGS